MTYLPDLAEVFGLHPWDLDDLTTRELDVFIQRLNQMRASGNA